MKRTLLEGEEVLFEEYSLTVTNLRIWVGSRSKTGVSFRTIPIREVSEISMCFKRPLRGFIIATCWALALFAVWAMLPAKLLLVSISLIKMGILSVAGLIFLCGLVILFGGSALVLEIRSRSGSASPLSVSVEGIQADPEKIEALVHEIERLRCEKTKGASHSDGLSSAA